MDAAPILTLLKANTPTYPSPGPCERCAQGWGIVGGGEYCTCHYGQTLKAAKEKAWVDECAAWLLGLREASHLPARYATAKVADFVGAQSKVAAQAKAAFTAGRGLFLWGPVGTGKTHLAAALVNEELDAGRPVSWLVVPDWLERIRDTYGTNQSPADLLQRPREARLLLMDDLGVEKPSEWVREQLYTLINTRYLEGRAIIGTSNTSLAQLEGRIGDRTCSRLSEMCEALHLGGKDRRLG